MFLRQKIGLYRTLSERLNDLGWSSPYGVRTPMARRFLVSSRGAHYGCYSLKMAKVKT